MHPPGWYILFFYTFVNMQIALSNVIKERAKTIGFDACGLAKACLLSHEMTNFDNWLQEGYEGEMEYMHNYRHIRKNPDLLQKGAKTVLVCLSNYYPQQLQAKDLPQIAKYAYGRDYHKVLLKMQKRLLNSIREKVNCEGRIFVDSAPVMERSWAVKAGLGWIGKSGMLISPTVGVHTLISGMVLNIEVDNYDQPMQRSCGKCSRCIDFCPGKAIIEPGVIDANKCLSYLSIEHRGLFPENTSLQNNIFGCDVCIDVCPFNKKTPHQITDFIPPKQRIELNTAEWEKLQEEEFNALFNGTPVKRTKYKGIKRNLKSL